MKNKKNQKKIKAVIFDIGGVLALEKKPKRLFAKVHEFGVHEFMIDKLKVPLDTYFDALDTNYAYAIEGLISEKRIVPVIAKNLNTTPRKLRKLFKKAYKLYFKQNKELYKFAFKLKKQGYKIAILSDQWYLSSPVLIPKKYRKRFNVVVISCEVGIRKPNPEIYKLTLKKLKVKPAEAVFIDNRKWNTLPAKKLGINAILFKNNNKIFRQLKKLGVKVNEYAGILKEN